MPAQLPAHLLNRQSKPVADNLVANLGSGAPPHVSIDGNKFTLIDATGASEPVGSHDPQIGVYFDCVIIDSNEHTSKIYYDQKYDPNAEGQAPACFSDNGLAPSRQSARPQAATCASCKWNVWGSATSNLTGKAIKGCHDVQKVAVMIPGDEVVFLMRVQPGSRKNFGAYVLKFKGSGADLSDVLTRISFESQGVLRFQATNYITPEIMAQREQALAEKKTDQLIGRGDMPVQGALAAPGSLPASTAAQQAFTPAVAPQQQPLVSHTPQAISTQPGVATATPASPTEQPQKRRRRTNAQMQEANQPVPAQAPFMPSDGSIPPILQRQPAPPANPAPFGIGQGVAPNPEVKAAIDSIFNS